MAINNPLAGITASPSGSIPGLGQQAGQAKTEATHPDTDLINAITDLLRTNGRVELVMNNSTIDVRSGGLAAYASGLRAALRSRIEVEVARVTNKLSGGDENKRAY